jgi:hypothetical protein
MSSCIESIVQQSSDDLVQAPGGYARTRGFTSSAHASHRAALRLKRRETRECLTNGPEMAPKRTRAIPAVGLPESDGSLAAAAPAGGQFRAVVLVIGSRLVEGRRARGLSCDIFDARHAVTRNAEAERMLRHMRYARPNPPQITSWASA